MSLIATGIRQFLIVPRPLALDTYESRTALSATQGDYRFAVLTMRSAYRAWLHRDGTFTLVRVVGGTRDAAFDSAFIAAVRQLSESRELPDAVSPAATFAGDSLDVRLLVTPDFISLRPGTPSRLPEGVNPLVQMRLPIVRVTQQLSPSPNNRAPHYPEVLRLARMQGDLLFEFVVGPSGLVDPASVQVLKGGATEFITAVNDELPKYRFKPLMVEGCAVRALVFMPFQFNLTY